MGSLVHGRLVGVKGGEWKINKRKVGRKLLKWLFGWEESRERKLEGPGVFLLGLTKTQFPQIVEIIGEKLFWTFWFLFFIFLWVLNMFVLWVLNMFLFSLVVVGFCFLFFLENIFGLISYAFLFYFILFILMKCPSIHKILKYIMCYFLFYLTRI